ncbi:MAG: 3'-5' exonuclease [Gemmataceae bacterium]|nr:3'-5' exonuclease [Gemmataceae bacterium]
MDASTRIAAEVKTTPSIKDIEDTRYIVFDTESIPDGLLVARVKYPEENLTPEEAIERAQKEEKAHSFTGSDFLPITFQKPVAISVLRVSKDLLPMALHCLDAPSFRTVEMVKLFWLGIEKFNRASLVTFNGRGFDLPLLELAAFEHGISCEKYFASDKRNRYRSTNIDLFDLMTNQGACKMVGGLNLLAKKIGLPGKMGTTGNDVYPMYKAGQLQEINDYCLCDTLDTYFVFLRSRVLIGSIQLEQEKEITARAVAWLQERVAEFPILNKYLQQRQG